jgi:hypothetical protein
MPGYGVSGHLGDPAAAEQVITIGLGGGEDLLTLSGTMDVRFLLEDATSALDHMLIRVAFIEYLGA